MMPIAVDDDEDESDLPPPGLPDRAIEAWFERRLGRRPTWHELRALMLRVARRSRRRLVDRRARGLSERETAVDIAREIMTSAEMQVAVAGGFALIRLGMEFSDVVARMLAEREKGRAEVARYYPPRRRPLPVAPPREPPATVEEEEDPPEDVVVPPGPRL